MKHQDMKADVLFRYLSDDSTKAEKTAVEQWIEADPRNRQKFEAFKRIWETSATRFEFENRRFDAEEDWDRLSRRIDQYSTQSTSKGTRHLATYNHTGRFPWQMVLRTAAIFLVAALIGLFAYQSWGPVENNEKEPSLREITTAMGQRVNLKLSDGTKVLLNAGSEMKLPEVFDTNKREVFLEGQAYFDVVENPNKPFIIHSGNAETRVLGTSFSIRAYPADGEITVAVKEGSVSFDADTPSGEQHTVLNNLEFAHFDRQTRQLETNDIDDMEFYLGWVDGSLKFKKTPMASVAKELERRYGVTVTFADEDIKQRLVTAFVNSRSIKNVLDLISMSLSINYKIDEEQVVFLKS